MRATVQQRPLLAEVNKVDHVADELRAAKVRVGEAVRDAIDDDGLKRHGNKGLMSGLTSGEKVPKWLASIAEDDNARRRFALSLLKGDPQVRTRMVITCEWDGDGK